MPMIVHPDHVAEFEEPIYEDEIQEDLFPALEIALKDYQQMIRNGVPIEEARMVLPNACAVNLIWTVNARALIGFFKQRLCRRNVEEMQIFAGKIWGEVNDYWPEFAQCCGPYCYPSGKCNQGKMSCGRPYKPFQSLGE